MNKIPALLLVLLLALLPSTLRAQTGYKVDKVTPTFVQTPDYQIPSAPHQEPNPVGKWLEVEVQFEVPQDTDEMTVKYYVVVNGKLLAGEVSHVNVPKGRELYSVMYVSPQSLTTLLAGKPATATSIADVEVQLVIKGQVVADGASKPGQFAPEWWTKMQQITGLLLNKNETPFGPLYWDRYPQIKSSEH
jgi:hypothetical protein